MNDPEFVATLYGALFRRQPSETEVGHWVANLKAGMKERDLLSRFLRSKEYLNKTRVSCTYPPGHYYSPIVDPQALDPESLCDRNLDPKLLPGIRIDDEPMISFWDRNAVRIAATKFPVKQTPEFRYFSDNKVYPIGDAVLLRTMMLEKSPKRFIEIGSGFSSACALDAADEGGLHTDFTFIEPYTERLRSTLRPQDDYRVQIIEKFVQQVPLSVFGELGEDDILLIDSTHVMKTGSDVHYELFKILPSLKPGVIIHFHDMHYPFEYPNAWIFESNFSWNEVYALRAFLMHNEDYQIEFFNSYFRQRFGEVIRATYPRFLENPGGSLWLKKVGARLPV